MNLLNLYIFIENTMSRHQGYEAVMWISLGHIDLWTTDHDHGKS